MNTKSKIAWAALALAAALVVPVANGAEAPVLEQPKPHSISYYYDFLDKSVFRPVGRPFDPVSLVRTVGGIRRQAVNVDERDEVRLPSTWWQPRLGYRAVSVEQVLRGAGPGTGPAPGKWTVVRGKSQGVSQGFQIKDSEGVRFAIKFDPVGFPELTTGSDVVVSKIYWAAGYNVPDNTIANIRREDLQIDPKAMVTGVDGRKKPMTQVFLDRVLSKVPKNADGSYRAVASRFLTGVPLGEWEYDGNRNDDPEDPIPHQLRREIRGLWAINAWANHTDCSARNTIDMWVTDGGRSFVRHHLIDFSGCLGSGSIEEQSPRNGHEYLVDFPKMGASLITLGLHQSRWEDGVDPDIPGVGYFESAVFDAEHWKPFLPNPAFDLRSDRDARWGARIVAAFTDELIRAAVAEGHYSDPRASDYLVRTLIERRDKIARFWLGRDKVAGSGR